MNAIRVEIILAFSDCSPKITNKGYDVFDTPALALSHPLRNPGEATDEEKTTQSTPGVTQDARQGGEEGGAEAAPQPIQQEKITALNPTENYRLCPRFERCFIDLGRLMVEEGFDLSTYTQVQDLLSEDWKLV